jgi:heterodisulfide reductase subunit C
MTNDLRKPAEQEPVLWMCHDCGGANQLCPHGHKDAPLYLAPPKKEWVGLTNEEVLEAIDDVLEGGGWLDVARALEAAIKRKNT